MRLQGRLTRVRGIEIKSLLCAGQNTRGSPRRTPLGKGTHDASTSACAENCMWGSCFWEHRLRAAVFPNGFGELPAFRALPTPKPTPTGKRGHR